MDLSHISEKKAIMRPALRLFVSHYVGFVCATQALVIVRAFVSRPLAVGITPAKFACPGLQHSRT
jgi:hypothetical protein